MQQITGFDATRMMFTNPTQSADILFTVMTDFQAGDMVVLSTNVGLQDAHLLGQHVYYMTGFDAMNQTLTLTNPYWYQGDKTVTANLTQLENDFQAASVAVVPQ